MRKLMLSLGLALLMGCGIGGLQDVKGKTEKLQTQEELEKVLGKPTKVSGGAVPGFSMESHIYEASDGVATFVILNGKITFRTYVPKDGK